MNIPTELVEELYQAASDFLSTLAIHGHTADDLSRLHKIIGRIDAENKQEHNCGTCINGKEILLEGGHWPFCCRGCNLITYPNWRLKEKQEVNCDTCSAFEPLSEEMPYRCKLFQNRECQGFSLWQPPKNKEERSCETCGNDAPIGCDATELCGPGHSAWQPKEKKE